MPITYHDWLSSPQWAALAAEAKARAQYRCALSAAHRGPVEAHHRTYARLGRERPEDIIVLCEACHRHFHRRLVPWQAREMFLPFDLTETRR